MKKNSALHMIVTLVAIAAIVAGLMAFFNDLTKPIIEENSIKALNESLSRIVSADKYLEEQFGENTVYIAIKNNKKAGVLVSTSVKGYGGEIKLLVGIDEDNKVIGVEILENSETAGLGANATKPEFLNQYRGKDLGVGVSKTNASEKEIKAISGATVTSKAVTEGVNTALKIAENF
jgi:electron transport complex protein RnfG